MEKYRNDEKKERKKSREGVEKTRDAGKKKKENRQRVMEERKCFACEGFRHIAYSCRNVEEEGPALVLLNKFEVLKDRVI